MTMAMFDDDQDGKLNYEECCAMMADCVSQVTASMDS